MSTVAAPPLLDLPEGDPMSIVGMYCLTYWFRNFVLDCAPTGLPIGYADNWEALFNHVSDLCLFLPELAHFLAALKLPVNPGKCWTWSLDPSQRKSLKGLSMYGQLLPVKLKARELGADVSYCLLKAAKVRNLRIQSAHKRLSRLAGLPLPRPFKQRLLLSGIWPHALHAAETASVPKSVFKRLRTQAARAMGLKKKGTNPFLACLLASPAIVDPQYVLLSNRIALFRQVLRELPEYKGLFVGQLACPVSRYKGPTRLLVKALGNRGWALKQGAVFEDVSGRVFHLFMSPLRHIRYLLSTTWTTFVCAQISHRKGLTDIDNIDLVVSKDLSSLRKEEKGLVLHQQVGSFYTEDYRKHCGGITNCPLCGLPDSRAHRLEDCRYVDHVRRQFPNLMSRWGSLPDHLRHFGLFEEPESLRDWQACLDRIPWPFFPRSSCEDTVMIYTDGGCLFPRWSHLRLASYASIVLLPSGGFSILAQGLLPGSCHTAYRAEIMALCSAVRSFLRPVVTLDCKGVVDDGNRILDELRSGMLPRLPTENTDLWAFFVEGLQGTFLGDVILRWVRGHVDWRKCADRNKVDAWYNHWADQVAGSPLHWCSRHCQLYRRLIKEFRDSRMLAAQVFAFHARVGMVFSGVKAAGDDSFPVMVPNWAGFGVAQSCGFVDVHACNVCHVGFARKLLRWLESLSFYPSSCCGQRHDTSWLELFWSFLHTTSVLPPIAFEGSWRTVDEDENLLFVIPPFRVLFRTWKRCLDALVRGGLELPVGPLIARVDSIAHFGGKFACPGFAGFVPLATGAADGLAIQLSEASCLRDLRIPFFN